MYNKDAIMKTKISKSGGYVVRTMRNAYSTLRWKTQSSGHKVEQFSATINVSLRDASNRTNLVRHISRLQEELRKAEYRYGSNV